MMADLGIAEIPDGHNRDITAQSILSTCFVGDHPYTKAGEAIEKLAERGYSIVPTPCRYLTDRILVRDVLVRAKEEQERRVLSPYPEPMASISAQERALLSHAVPDQSGTRRVVIEQRAGEDAVMLGLDVVVDPWIKSDSLYRLSPLPKENHDV